MKCPTCQSAMTSVVASEFDYTKLAGLRGKRVTLHGVVLYCCSNTRCKQPNSVEIPRLAALHRELTAAGTLRVKKIAAQFANGEWSISFGVS